MAMWPWVPAAISAAGSLIGGAISGSGQRDANKSNERIARENREFQERMSNTSVQRRQEDLRKAGINPILAGRYDASSPAGSIATMGNVGAAKVEGAKGGSAVGLRLIEAQNIQASTGKTIQETENLRQSNVLIAEQAVNQVKIGLGLDQDVKRKQFEAELSRLRIAEAETYEKFWLKVQSMSAEELAVFAGKVGGAGLVGAAVGMLSRIGGKKRLPPFTAKDKVRIPVKREPGTHKKGVKR